MMNIQEEPSTRIEASLTATELEALSRLRSGVLLLLQKHPDHPDGDMLSVAIVALEKVRDGTLVLPLDILGGGE